MAARWIRGAGSNLKKIERLRARTLPPNVRSRLATEVLGQMFPSPVGLGAGFDKGEVLGGGLFAMGFGFVEIGTITPKPQRGNPRPRVFRIPSHKALINRMGFNNAGAATTAERLRAWPAELRLGPVGLNIGKNKDTPLAEAAEDYCRALEPLLEFADYVAVNVSSPNTPGLRKLQTPEFLTDILDRVVKLSGDIPVLVKIDPDQTLAQVDSAVDIAGAAGCAGIIATNTTVSREGIEGAVASQSGGLSGVPMAHRALSVLRRVYSRCAGQMICIGVGGIDSAPAAYERIKAGASLVQIYTGMIFEGPSLIAEINAGLTELLQTDGYDTIADAVGVDS